jgi:DNA-directed RNA polymerase specialized sigma subunit
MEEIPEQMGITSMQLLDVINAFSLTSLNMEVNNDNDDNIGELSNVIADWKNMYEDLVFQESFSESMERVLSLREEPAKSICEEWVYATMFGEKLSQHYFADKYGKSQAHVSRTLKRFKDDLLFYLDFKLEE